MDDPFRSPRGGWEFVHLLLFAPSREPIRRLLLILAATVAALAVLGAWGVVSVVALVVVAWMRHRPR